MPSTFAHVRVSAFLASAALTLLLSPPQAHADTYSLVTVAYTDAADFTGIDNSNNFAIDWNNKPGHCGAMFGPCYQTFSAGVSTGFTTTAPTLSYVNGTACKPIVAAGFFSDLGVCNGSHNLFGGGGNPANPHQLIGIWTVDSSGGIPTYLGFGKFDSGYMNSNGDAVFIDGYDDTLVFAEDLTTMTTTPEPTSLLLLGTGSLAALATLRRRLSR